MRFASQLKKLLQETNVSQVQFAEELGITRARLNHYTTGRSEPDYALLVRIADKLNVTTDFLLGRKERQQSRVPCVHIGIPEFVAGEEMPPPETGNWLPLYESIPDPFANGAKHAVPHGWLRSENLGAKTYQLNRPYALLIQDDSMPSELLRGDIVYIQPSFFVHTFLLASPIQDIFAVRLRSEDEVGLSLKRCYLQGNLLICIADNPAFHPIVLDMDATLFVPLVGTIAGIWRTYQDKESFAQS